MVVAPFFSLIHISESAGLCLCSMTMSSVDPEAYSVTGSPDVQKQSDGRGVHMVTNDRF